MMLFNAVLCFVRGVHLNTVLEKYPVSVISGKGYVEVRPTGINKGAMVDHVVSQLYAEVTTSLTCLVLLLIIHMLLWILLSAPPESTRQQWWTTSSRSFTQG